MCLTAVSVQSKHANSPPQTAKLPPTTGARALHRSMAPRNWSPRCAGAECTGSKASEKEVERAPRARARTGELRKPLMECQIDPPTAPIANAPPTSSMMRYGHGSRPEYSPIARGDPGKRDR